MHLSTDSVDSHFTQVEQPKNDVQMGESETAMEYDQDLIFKHLHVHNSLYKLWLTHEAMYRCFYLDSPDNARQNGMPVKSKREDDINRRYALSSSHLTPNIYLPFTPVSQNCRRQ